MMKMGKDKVFRIILVITALMLSGCQEEDIKNQRIIEEIQDCENCPAMVLIPKGHFMMGALPYDKQADKYEKPRHSVEIRRDFYLGKYEVTYGQYMTCVREGGCSFTPPNMLEECQKKLGCSVMFRKDKVDINKLPVVGVSYNDAQEYVAWLSEKTGQAYRLPTEEEWEYAARGGTETIFWWGDEIGDGHTVCSGCDMKNDMLDIPLHVGHYPPNPFGLHDMLGNAQEIVGGCLVETFDLKIPRRDEPNCQFHMVRGGAWGHPILRSRVSDRAAIPSNRRSESKGFRIAKTAKITEKGDKK